jgi:hypothetical protein
MGLHAMIASPNSLLSSAPVARLAVRLAPVPTRPAPRSTRQLCHKAPAASQPAVKDGAV